MSLCYVFKYVSLNVFLNLLSLFVGAISCCSYWYLKVEYDKVTGHSIPTEDIKILDTDLGMEA